MGPTNIVDTRMSPTSGLLHASYGGLPVGVISGHRSLGAVRGAAYWIQNPTTVAPLRRLAGKGSPQHYTGGLDRVPGIVAIRRRLNS